MSKESAEYLEKFLWENRLSITKFAKLADVARYTVYKYLNGGNVQPKTARRIKENIESKTTLLISVKKLID